MLLRREADSPQLTGVYERGFIGEEAYLPFHYQVVRVWRLSPKPLLTGGLALLPPAPVSAVTKADLLGIIQRMGQRLNARSGRPQAKVIPAAAYVLLGLKQAKVPHFLGVEKPGYGRRAVPGLPQHEQHDKNPLLVFFCPTTLSGIAGGSPPCCGSGRPDPDFSNLAVNNATPSPAARRSVGTGSRTTSETPACDRSAPTDTVAARTLGRMF